MPTKDELERIGEAVARPDYLTHAEAAAVLRCTPKALYNMNHRGAGPPRLRVGGRVLYPRARLIAWIDAQEIE